MLSPSQQEKPLLELKKVSKKFGTRWANEEVSFVVNKGQIHGLIGENGAGKSTIMKILFGLHQADQGEIFINSVKVNIRSPLDAFKHKIGMVHQHFMLSPAHTALENILLIQDQQKPFEIYSQIAKIEKIKAKAKEFNFEIPWDKKVSELPVGIQQRIEILKLLNLEHEILIFDEPTAVLTPLEIEEFLNQLQQLKQKGKTIILITHKLKEVKKVCDLVTVFKKGRCLGTFPAQSLSEAQMAELMVGRHVAFQKRNFKKFPSAQVLLHLKNILFKKNTPSVSYSTALGNGAKTEKESKFHFDFNFDLLQGEILGVAGIEGNGQNELIDFLLNPTKYKRLLDLSQSPEYQLAGDSFLNTSSQKIREKALAIFPEDRLHLGSIPSMRAFENFILGYQRKKSWQQGGFLSWTKIKEISQERFNAFQVEPKINNLAFNSYSGGNQQKMVVARELFHSPDFILAAHPTRGVDIGAIELIHEQLIQAQERGAGILLISSELDELTKLSDRILVIREGMFVKSFERSEFDECEIGEYMLGTKE